MKKPVLVAQDGFCGALSDAIAGRARSHSGGS